MSSTRQRRAKTVDKIAQVLDATEQLMVDQGYAAVTSRNVAAAVGINPPMVHYYVGSIDDLFIAVLNRRAEANVQRMTEALRSDEPLRGWWELASDPRGAALFVEFIAVANHRPALRKTLGEHARRLRSHQMTELTRLLPEYGLSPTDFPPSLIAAATHGLAFGLVADEAALFDTATDEVRQAMDRLVTRLEDQRRDATPS